MNINTRKHGVAKLDEDCSLIPQMHKQKIFPYFLPILGLNEDSLTLRRR
jgi:hypothetical protein